MPSRTRLLTHQHLTEPKSPYLRTKLRSKPLQMCVTLTIPQCLIPSRVSSAEEREREDLAELKQFKARPVNQNILHGSGALGVPKVAKKALTKPKVCGFSLPLLNPFLELQSERGCLQELA